MKILCNTCFGCLRQENKDFKGVTECPNYIEYKKWIEKQVKEMLEDEWNGRILGRCKTYL